MFYRFCSPISRMLNAAVIASLALASVGTALGAEPSPLKNLHASLDAVTESNFYSLDSSKHSLESALILTPSYQFGKVNDPEYTLSAVLALSRIHSIYEKNELQNPKFNLRRKPFAMGRFFGFSPGVSATLALNDEAIKKDSFQGALGVSPRLTFNLAQTNRNPFSKLSGYLQVSATRNFHQYTRKIGGASNVKYGLAPQFNLSYAPLSALSVSSSVARSFNFTYLGNVSQSFEFNQELAYEINTFLSAAAGLNIKGNAYKENGIDSNVSVFDGDRSTFYGSIGIKI